MRTAEVSALEVGDDDASTVATRSTVATIVGVLTAATAATTATVSATSTADSTRSGGIAPAAAAATSTTLDGCPSISTSTGRACSAKSTTASIAEQGHARTGISASSGSLFKVSTGYATAATTAASAIEGVPPSKPTATRTPATRACTST